MSFLVLLLALLLEKFSGVRAWIQRDGLILDLLRRAEATQPRPWLVLAGLVLAPCLVLWLILTLLAPLAYGWLLLPLHLLVMLFALGRGDVLVALGPFRDAWRREDSQAAYHAAQRDLGIEAEESGELIQRVRGHLVWQAYQGFFAVIFWYALLGPLPVLAYRLLALIQEHGSQQDLKDLAGQLRHAFDWLPARALAGTFALVGQFEAVLNGLLERLLDWNATAHALLADSALAATNLQGAAEPADDSGLDRLWLLLVRSAIGWYLLFALWTILV